MLPKTFLKFIGLIIATLMLTQCAKVMDRQSRTNQQLASPYTMPAPAYLALAKNQAGSEKQSLLIMAAGRMVYDGQWRQGLSILSQTKDLSAAQQDEKNLLLAKTYLIREQPRNAIIKLSAVREIDKLPQYYQIQFHEMLASAYQLAGNDAESVSERIKLETILPDETARSNNRRVLWLALTKLPAAELQTLALEAPDDSVEQGWMRLALIPRQHRDNPDAMLASVEQWQQQYPSHPAKRLLPSPLADIKQNLYAPPKKMALLLPLSGPLAGPGSAIRDGFLAAHYKNNASSAVKIRFYNTDNANAAKLYQQAIDDGADYVVGPLSKTEVASVASINHPVPTLLLNDLATKTKKNTYQFGLSPSGEARQVAVKARKNGHTRALIIAPNSSWGDEIVAAFSTQWRMNGGHVVDRFSYATDEDMNMAIRDFLHISDSEARSKELKQLLGRKVQSTPARRQDFDVIFLLAYPSKARQIMPLLKYYYAGDIPVYATSTVYAGNHDSIKDRDLDGIIFCDMPWVFNHQVGNKNWPEQLNSYNRLYALGMDSYALATELNQLLLFPAMGVNDKSGILYLNGAQQIARIPAWGQFKEGTAQIMNDNQ